jgi:hypothetical protein
VATKPRNKIRHSEPLEGEDARRFVDDVESGPRSEEQRHFLAESKGLFARIFATKNANHFFRS